jgi:uncharacterized protein
VILLDTSGLLAAMFNDQADHAACRRVLQEAVPPLVLSPFVLAELDYLVGRLAGVDAELALLLEVSEGAYEVPEFTRADVARARQVVARHRDLRIGLADASLAVLSERIGTLDVLTLDERHFRTVMGAGGRPFRLLPADA